MERENQCSKRSDVLPKDKRTRIGVLTVREHCKIFIFLQNIVKLHDITRIPWQNRSGELPFPTLIWNLFCFFSSTELWYTIAARG